LEAMIESTSCTVGFCDQYVRINSSGRESADLIDFLCCDLRMETGDSPRAIYDFKIAGRRPMLSLRLQGEQLYWGDCRYDLAYTLVNEIIHQCITDNRAGFAIHAAAIGSEKGGVLLPGKSGSGKSTLITWLVSRGCNYLTDELVILAGDDHCIYPFTRPISIKTGSSSTVAAFLNYDPQKAIAGANGFMLPHRLVNTVFFPAVPPLSLILFPRYKAGAVTDLKKLSDAFGFAKLIECYVNARNLRDHGISQLAELTKRVSVYQLTYSSFDGLDELLSESFPTLFQWKKNDIFHS